MVHDYPVAATAVWGVCPPTFIMVRTVLARRSTTKVPLGIAAERQAALAA
jgi:hypothetical protein